MKSQEIQQQITDSQQRRADISAQHDAANDELRTAQKQFAKGRADVNAVTTAQAKVSGISGALELLLEDMRAQQIEYSVAVADETRAAQLEQLKAKTEVANITFQAYGAAQIESVTAIEIAAKSLLETFEHFDAAHISIATFLQQPETVVALSDLDIDTTGATSKLPWYGAPTNGGMPTGEDGVYLQKLHELMVFVVSCKDSVRPCPKPPTDI
jgi:hypothetical protein